MNEYKKRLSALAAQLPENADAALVTSQVSRYYLTGLDIDNGFLLVTREGSALVTDFRYIETAQSALEDVCEAVMYEVLSDTLRGLLQRFGASRVLIEREVVTFEEGARLAKALSPAVILTDCSALDDAIRAMRISKSAIELQKLRESQAVTERSFEYILGFVKEGMTEREIALELEFFMRKAGAQRVAFDLIVAAGANGSMPHAVPSDYRVQKGDFITIDMGAVVKGYHSDMTRTFALGSVSEEQRRVYDIVLRAQLAGVEYLTSGGTDCRAADAVARDIIAAEGFGGQFGHSLGHGVGLEIHEKPNLSTRAEGTLSEGCVVTVEPGIYLPGRFGIRIEDMLYITDGSAIDLTGVPKELLIV